MTAYADLHEYVNRKTGGNSGTPEFILQHKESRVAGAAAATPVAGRYHSLWQYEGHPSHGSAPGAVAAPDNTTTGGIFQTAPGGGRQRWLDWVWAQMSAAGTIIIYDRLLHISGLSGTVTTAQTVGGSLTRNTGGKGNQIWVEVYTQIGASSTTITASYTNQAGTSGRTTAAVAIGNTGLREAQRLIPLSLQAGDYGVQAVASVTLAATTGTAGDFGVTVMRPIAVLGMSLSGVGCSRSYLDGVLADISTSCVAAAFFANAATVPVFDLFYSSAER